jgi:mRNA interferase MazF
MKKPPQGAAGKFGELIGRGLSSRFKPPSLGHDQIVAIQYPVAPRTIILCDYALGGFRPPEMVKRRPAVVVSPRLPHRDGLCAVVPLSGTPPSNDVDYVVRIELDKPLPEPFSEVVWWAKCDMIATVGFNRLDLFRAKRDPGGNRKYLHPFVSMSDFDRIRQGVLSGLGLAT